MSTRDEVLEIIRVMPGLNAGQISELMPHVKNQAVHSSLNWLYVSGKARRELGDKGKHGKPTYTWFVSETGKPLARQFKIVDRVPRVASDACVTTLKARIAELERWQANAIARFPDLGVDPIIYRARQIVAAELRATGDSGDRNMADAVQAGQRDTVLAMRLVIKMLEEKAA